MLQSKAFRFTAHVVGWILLLGLLYGFMSVWNEGETQTNHGFSRLSVILFVLCYIVIFYTNKLVLVPRLYLNRKYVAYFGIFLALLAAVYFLKPFENLIVQHEFRRPMHRPPFQRNFPGHPPMPPRHGARPDITSIIMFIMVWSLSFGLEITRQWRRTEQKAAQMEAEKARAELNILKAQINPHFLFNTLNNIYALAVTGNEHTAPSIMKLSQIMRYITETAQQDEVPLESAVTCITDYIDLHRLRLNRQAQIDYTVTGQLTGLYISPLILLPFVENIFKYGISSHEPSPVTIRMEASEKQLYFFCQNRIFLQQRISESTGIGIDNTRKRLALLYPNKHRLHISTNDGLFTVNLEVHL